jgi:energy-coupling factor transporter ATP-binding protein EcfA2
MSERSKPTPATLFYSYAHADEALRDQLETHLSLLQRQGWLSSWYDRALLPGDDWAGQIDSHLTEADIILLLVSADFLASDYCYDVEMTRALERHHQGEARVVPIILRPCDWSSAPFGKLQALPRNAQAITTWSNQEEALTQVAQQLRRLLKQHQTAASTPASRSAGAIAQQNRERMQRRLKQWYQDFLSQSLQESAWLDLGFVEQPNALTSPVSLLIRGTSLPDRLKPPGTSILQVYDEAQQELLILGEPGSGKSTQLYILGQHLLTRSETHQHAPLPFIFSLSSWASKRQALEIWMAQQLVEIYQVPKKMAQQWVENHQVIPLLDGLDEMEDTARPRCIQEINRYHQEHLHPLVACCRSAEYATAAQTDRLLLQQAVVVQPLSQQQITDTFSKGGKALAGLRAAYKQNSALQELATAPLLLNLLILAYQGIPVRDLPTQEKYLEDVLQTYVGRMVTQKGNGTRYPPTVTRRWLQTLAIQMHTHHLTEWGIEQLQPDWLSQTFQWRYRWSVGLVGGLIFGLILGLVFGLGAGLIGGLVGGLIVGLGAGLIFGLFFVLIVGLNKRRTGVIYMVEGVEWSWKGVQWVSIRRLIGGLINGFIIGLIFGLILKLIVGLDTGLIVGLDTGLIGGLFMGLLGGVESRQMRLVDSSILIPGEGLKRTVKNGLRGGVIVGLIVALGIGLIVALIKGPIIGLLAWLIAWLIVWLLIGSEAGLYNSLQHFILRFWLWSSHSLPFRLIPFLEDARSRHLLKRVGGSYQFIHRVLLDYFTKLEP